MPESAAERPPLIRRQEVVAIALVGLLVIAVTTVLYFGKAFFLPVVMAFVVGTEPSQVCGPARFAAGVRPATVVPAAVPAEPAAAAPREGGQTP